MTKEAQRLVEDNHNLIYKFLRNHNLEDDWYDVAAIGLYKAANNYNSDKYEFSTYAYICMYIEMWKDNWIYNNVK